MTCYVQYEPWTQTYFASDQDGHAGIYVRDLDDAVDYLNDTYRPVEILLIGTDGYERTLKGESL
jgi:hypothetical protein